MDFFPLWPYRFFAFCNAGEKIHRMIKNIHMAGQNGRLTKFPVQEDQHNTRKTYFQQIEVSNVF